MRKLVESVRHGFHYKVSKWTVCCDSFRRKLLWKSDEDRGVKNSQQSSKFEVVNSSLYGTGGVKVNENLTVSSCPLPHPLPVVFAAQFSGRRLIFVASRLSNKTVKQSGGIRLDCCLQ